MEWLLWLGLAIVAVAIAAAAPRMYRAERERQRGRGTLPGGFGVVDEIWNPTAHAARLEREQREEVGAESEAAREPEWLREVASGQRDDDDTGPDAEPDAGPGR